MRTIHCLSITKISDCELDKFCGELVKECTDIPEPTCCEKRMEYHHSSFRLPSIISKSCMSLTAFLMSEFIFLLSGVIDNNIY